jgi:hypothetical protein
VNKEGLCVLEEGYTCSSIDSTAALSRNCSSLFLLIAHPLWAEWACVAGTECE